MSADTLTRPAVPAGLCQCGCGQATQIAPRRDRRYGVETGKPRRYVKGHNTRGLIGVLRPHPPATDVPPGTPRCVRCNYPMVSTPRPTPVPAGWGRREGRGLCTACYSHARAAGTRDAYPRTSSTRATSPREEVLAEVETLHSYGTPRRDLASLIGISEQALCGHLRRGRAAGDPRAYLYSI